MVRLLWNGIAISREADRKIERARLARGSEAAASHDRSVTDPTRAAIVSPAPRRAHPDDHARACAGIHQTPAGLAGPSAWIGAGAQAGCRDGSRDPAVLSEGRATLVRRQRAAAAE